MPAPRLTEQRVRVTYILESVPGRFVRPFFPETPAIRKSTKRKANVKRFKIIGLVALVLACLGLPAGERAAPRSAEGLAPWCRGIEPYSMGPGVVIDPDLVSPITDDAQFHRVMTDGDDANFFGGLFYAVEKYLRTGDESYRPVILLQAMGGGADVAGTLAQGVWLIDLMCRQPSLQRLFSERFGQPLTPETLTQTHLVDFSLVVCPEKRLSHQMIGRNAREKLSYQNAFYEGSLIRNAGLPTPIHDAVPVVPRDGRGSLRLIFKATETASFEMTVPGDGPEAAAQTILGRPIEDVRMIPLVQRMLGSDKLYLFSMHGTIGQARDEFRRFLKDVTALGPEHATQERAFRPLFALYPDPGGDTWVKRNPLSTTTQQISPANEAYNSLVAGIVFENSLNEGAKEAPHEVKALFTPMSMTADGESNAEAANRALSNLGQAGALAGVSLGMPPDILIRVIGETFMGDKPLLTSHANLMALKRLLRLGVAIRADGRDDEALRDLFGLEGEARAQGRTLQQFISSLSMREFMDLLRPLQTLGEMPRTDVPVIKKESIVEGPATQCLFFLRARPAYRYLLDILEMTPAEVNALTYERLRGRLENLHLVIGENQLPSSSEYEWIKALAIREPAVRAAIIRSGGPEQLMALMSPKQADRTTPILPLSNGAATMLALMPQSREYAGVRRELALQFIRDSMSYVDSTTGVLRMNPPYVRAYFANLPALNRCFEQDPGLESRLCAEFYDEMGQEIMAILFETLRDKTRNGMDMSYVETLAAVFERGARLRDLPDDASRIVSMGLKIARLNPRCHYAMLAALAHETAPEAHMLYFAVAKLQVVTIRGRLEHWVPHTIHNLAKREGLPANIPLTLRTEDELERSIESYRQVARRVGLDSGNYEKLIKSFSNLLLLQLAVGQNENAYMTMNILYAISPAHIDEPWRGSVLSRYDNVGEFMDMMRFIMSLRKGDRDFVNTINELVLRAAGGIEGLGVWKSPLDPIGNFMLGLYLVTAPEQGIVFMSKFMTFGNVNRENLFRAWLDRARIAVEILEGEQRRLRDLQYSLRERQEAAIRLEQDASVVDYVVTQLAGGDVIDAQALLVMMEDWRYEGTIRRLETDLAQVEVRIRQAEEIYAHALAETFGRELTQAA